MTHYIADYTTPTPAVSGSPKKYVDWTDFIHIIYQIIHKLFA